MDVKTQEKLLALKPDEITPPNLDRLGIPYRLVQPHDSLNPEVQRLAVKGFFDPKDRTTFQTQGGR